MPASAGMTGTGPSNTCHEPNEHTALTTHADIHAHRLLILDFGSQYTQLIARRVREIGLYCEIHPYDMDDAELRAFQPKGIIAAF